MRGGLPPLCRKLPAHGGLNARVTTPAPWAPSGVATLPRPPAPRARRAAAAFGEAGGVGAGRRTTHARAATWARHPLRGRSRSRARRGPAAGR
jgi:hypothetical protein